jgi:hypothetical protein
MNKWVSTIQDVKITFQTPDANSKYRQPGLLCTKFKRFRKKYFLVFFGYLWGFFKYFPKFEGHTSSGIHTNETLNLLTKLWSFKVIRTFFGARSWLCCARCSSRWSDQKSCKTGYVALKTSCRQTRPMWALQTHFLARYTFLKWGSKFRIFFTKLWKS